jgi:ATP-dependent DNA helicase RecG
VDLQLRGPGEFFGTHQSGMPELRIANLVEDGELVSLARAEAFELIQNDPHLRQKDHECIRNHFEKEYSMILELGKIG